MGNPELCQFRYTQLIQLFPESISVSLFLILSYPVINTCNFSNLITASLLPLLPVLPLISPLTWGPCTLLSSVQRRASLQWISTKKVISFECWIMQPSMRIGSQSQQKKQRQTLFPLLGVSKEDQGTQL